MSYSHCRESIWKYEPDNMNSVKIVECFVCEKNGKYSVIVDYLLIRRNGSESSGIDYHSGYRFKTAVAARRKANKLERIYTRGLS